MTNDSQYISPVKNIKIYNFRNIRDLSFDPSEKLNIIYGDNAKGKTNLIESIWMFTGEKSFRKVKESQLILMGEKKARLDLSFLSSGRHQTSTIKWEPQKSIYLNECKVDSIADFIGTFSAIIFSPEDLSLIKGSPQKRRSFLDVALSQIKSRYTKLLIEYNRILSQRNALLKDISRYPSLINTLDVWDYAYIKISSTITKYRLKYIKALIPLTEEIYFGISDQKEKLEIKYLLHDNLSLDIDYDELCDYFKEKILKIRKLDIRLGFSQIGPHRDDFDVMINGLSAKNFASQGQQRSVVLTLKLAEAKILKNLMKKNPVILLDDVMSELDFNRKKYILKHLKDTQCFITCCDRSYFNDISDDISLYKIDDLIK